MPLRPPAVRSVLPAFRRGVRVLLAALPAAAGLLPAAEPGFYREPRSYGSKRDPEPPAYARNLGRVGVEAWRDLTWLDVGLDSRFRFEYRDDDVRRDRAGLDDLLLVRTRAYLGIRDLLDPFRFAVELQDSRSYGSEFDTDGRDVNEFDLIALYGELHFKEALGSDALGQPRPLSLRAGRMNFEFLDRRLLGNNQWRNTANAFQGFRATLGQEVNDWQLDLLAVQPLERDKYGWDEARERQWVYGAIGHWRGWSDFITLEPYYLGLNQASADGAVERQIHAAALRGYGLVGASGFDYDFDAVYQFGRSGSEKHRAFGLTGELGYRFRHAWQPRLGLFYGYASGDRDPNDGENQRFERFFGFSRPWSANDSIVWENLHAPKLRLELQPRAGLRLDAGYSAYWLASDTDRWANAGLRDSRGRSGRFIGHEFDVRARLRLNRHVEATLGYAHFAPGGFTRNAGKPRDTDFAYLELTWNAF